MKPAGLILAGGRGIRMGVGLPKPLRLLSGRPMVAHVADRLHSTVDPLLLNTGDAAAYEMLGLQVVPDLRPNFQGPLAGIEAGLEHLARYDGPALLLTLPGDTPFLPQDIVMHFPAVTDRPVVARHRGRLHPTVGLWPVDLLPVLSAWLDDSGNNRSIRAFLGTIDFSMTDVPDEPGAPGGDPFFNVNTAEDLAVAERTYRANAD